jgi:hypothetical protein
MQVGEGSEACVGVELEAVLATRIYLLYWYKSTNTDI